MLAFKLAFKTTAGWKFKKMKQDIKHTTFITINKNMWYLFTGQPATRVACSHHHATCFLFNRLIGIIFLFKYKGNVLFSLN
jgi:hypothetical protein